MNERLPLSFKLTVKRLFFHIANFYGRIFPDSKLAHLIAQSAQEHGLSSDHQPKNSQTLQEIVIFDQLIPTPDHDAGSARMVFILRALTQWSHPVFIPLGKRLFPKYEEQLWDYGIETGSILNYPRLIKERRPRAIVLSRPAVADALLKSIRRIAPESKIVYDMLDVHHLRAEREASLTGSASAAEEAKRLRQVETRVARASDLIWCGSLTDQEIVAGLAPGVRSVVVPTVHALHSRGLPFAKRKDLLFVGHFGHRPNTDAIHFLAREVLPLLRQAIPDIELLVVGLEAPPEFAIYATSGVKVLGFVPELGEVVEQARVFVAPIRFGSGVNGKIGESLAYGLPVVTTTIGAEGWGFTSGEQLLIADSPADFANAILRVYNDSELWQKLADGGHRHIQENNTPEVIGKIINDSVRDLTGAG
ncbi:MAG: glycosyltransferase [Pyrinomonadaceae bacterium]